LSGIEPDGTPRDNAVGQDKGAGAEVDSGFGEPVAKHVERGAIPGGGMNELAEKEERRIGLGGTRLGFRRGTQREA